MRGLGEGYYPGIKPARPWDGVYGADWRAVPGLSGTSPQFSIRGIPLMQQVNGLGGMGSLDEGTWQQIWMYVAGKISQTDFQTMKRFFDGSWASELRNLQAQKNSMKADLLSIKDSATTLEDIAAFEEAWQKYLAFEAEVLEAISYYNGGIWKIRDIKAYADALGVGFEAPEYMSGLGVLPVAVVVVIASALVAIYGSYVWRDYIQAGQLKTIAATNDAKALSSYISKMNVGGGLFEDVTGNITTGVSSTVKWAVIGLAVFFGAKLIIDSGGLKGVKNLLKPARAKK
jgi:hypothetical protein